MKTACCLFCAAMLVIGCAQTEKNSMKSDAIPPTGQHARSFEKTITVKLECDYLLFLPAGYGKDNRQWPLIMFLHGAGERGDNLNLVKKHGPPKIVSDRKDFPFIVVSPQCPADLWWTDKLDTLINLLDEIEASYDVDPARVYLTGLSMGGFGTWALASEHPDRFAAVVPICGGGERFTARRLKDVPVWAFHGGRDNVVPPIESEQMVEGVKRAGGDAKLTIYPDAGHDSWTATYDNPELYDWLLSHKNSRRK